MIALKAITSDCRQNKNILLVSRKKLNSYHLKTSTKTGCRLVRSMQLQGAERGCEGIVLPYVDEQHLSATPQMPAYHQPAACLLWFDKLKCRKGNHFLSLSKAAINSCIATVAEILPSATAVSIAFLFCFTFSF